MPPEYPTDSEDIFYKLLRPEFVSGYHVPLSSDSFSGFRGRDSKENDLQTKLATEDLYKVIEIFSREFSEMVDKEIEENWYNIANFHHKLPRIIHQAGINMRHLGILYNNSTTYNCKMLLLIEISARVIKHKLRAKMRNLMNEFKYPTEHHYISIVVKYMNEIFTSSEVWEEIREGAVSYFKIKPNDTITRLKKYYDEMKIEKIREAEKKKSLDVKKFKLFKTKNRFGSRNRYFNILTILF